MRPWTNQICALVVKMLQLPPDCNTVIWSPGSLTGQGEVRFVEELFPCLQFRLALNKYRDNLNVLQNLWFYGVLNKFQWHVKKKHSLSSLSSSSERMTLLNRKYSKIVPVTSKEKQEFLFWLWASQFWHWNLYWLNCWMGCGNQTTLLKTAEHQLLLRCHPLTVRTTIGKKNCCRSCHCSLPLTWDMFLSLRVWLCLPVLTAGGMWDGF